MIKPMQNRKEWLALLGMGIAYGALFYFRRHWYTLHCALEPSPCTPDSVNFVDQVVFRFGSVQADFYSNVLQNTVAVLAFTLPFLLLKKREAIQNFFSLSKLTLLNLILIEIARLTLQRPRPLVYHSPLTDGLNPHQYTSFYSGHTSFVALACFYSLYTLPINPKFRGLITVTAFALPFITGVLRVWGGRHFPTDVACGYLVGFMLAKSMRKST